MKKMFVCLLVLVMLISSTMVAHAEELFVSDTVMSKRMLAREHEDEYVEYSSLEEKKMAIERQQNIFALLGEMQANLMDYETGDVELEALGVYKLETESTPDEVNSRSTQPSDVSLNTVSIYLDAETSEWIVTTGGRWITLGWVDDMPSPFLWTAQIGAVYNIGGYDAFGVKLYNTSGTYNTSVNRSVLYYYDDEGGMYTSESPMAIDGRYGAIFQYQDKGEIVDKDLIMETITWKFIGSNFAIIVKYDFDFRNYDGYARAYYAHTWDECSISSVSAGISGTSPSFNVTFTDVSCSFECSSNSETRFH